MICNEPLTYAQLILGGNIEEYLNSSPEHKLDDYEILPVPIFSKNFPLTQLFLCPHAFHVNWAVTVTANIHISSERLAFISSRFVSGAAIDTVSSAIVFVTAALGLAAVVRLTVAMNAVLSEHGYFHKDILTFKNEILKSFLLEIFMFLY